MSLSKRTRIAAATVAAFYVAAGAALECSPAKIPEKDIVRNCLTGADMPDAKTQVIMRPVSCIFTPGALVGKAWKALSPP